MDAGSLIAGIGIGAGIGGAIATAVMKHAFAKSEAGRDESNITQRVALAMRTDAMRSMYRKLTNLRRNAYLTNEHGHRVRYSKASAEVRARAEAE